MEKNEYLKIGRDLFPIDAINNFGAGFKILDSEVKKVNGEKITFIKDVELIEISLVRKSK